MVDKNRRADRAYRTSRDRQLAQGFRADDLDGPGLDGLLREELADRAGVAGGVRETAFASPYANLRRDIRRGRDTPPLLYGVIPAATAVLAPGLLRPIGLGVVVERRSDGHREQVTDQEQPCASPPNRSIHRSTGGYY